MNDPIAQHNAVMGLQEFARDCRDKHLRTLSHAAKVQFLLHHTTLDEQLAVIETLNDCSTWISNDENAEDNAALTVESVNQHAILCEIAAEAEWMHKHNMPSTVTMLRALEFLAAIREDKSK